MLKRVHSFDRSAAEVERLWISTEFASSSVPAAAAAEKPKKDESAKDEL